MCLEQEFPIGGSVIRTAVGAGENRVRCGAQYQLRQFLRQDSIVRQLLGHDLASLAGLGKHQGGGGVTGCVHYNTCIIPVYLDPQGRYIRGMTHLRDMLSNFLGDRLITAETARVAYPQTEEIGRASGRERVCQYE